jgi:hypothetical protein
MADVVDLNGIKDNIKTLMDSKNVALSTPVDLSNNLTQRVKKVLTVNPEMIPPQASFFPFVTCYITAKNIIQDDIAKDQLSTKRKAEISIEIVGAVFNQNQTSVTKDPADTDINYLMENVELILRSDYNLGNKIKWQKPNDVQYYTSVVDARNHIRAGIMKITAIAYY